MQLREDHFGRAGNDFVMVFPPNWTAVWFFAILGTLHLCNAVPAFFGRAYEGYASFILACIFVTASAAWWRMRTDVGILSSERRLRLRTRLGRLRLERSISFDEVRAIRVFATEGQQSGDSRVEILCDSEDVECPPTVIARQQALHLAIVMGVELIKICDDEPPPADVPVPESQPH